MARLACISLPALALQTALRRFPAGFAAPVVLVRDDRPASPILSLNRAARRQGLRPGMRYSEALSVVCDLRAAVVAPADLEGVRQEVLGTLARWSPRVDPCPLDEGSFWADPEGLGLLFGTEADWGRGLVRSLADLRLRAVAVLGATRLGTYVLARSRRRSTVIHSPEAEARAVAQAPLEVFPLPDRDRRRLEKLGIATWGALLALPAAELARRFGPGLIQGVRALEAWDQLPVQGVEEVPLVLRRRRLEAPVTDQLVLAAHLDEPLDDALAELVRRGRLASELRLTLVLETGLLTADRLRPAEPTASRTVLRRLLGLRLAEAPPAAGVVELRLALAEVPLPRTSGDLFAPEVVRDRRRGAEALALLRAQWGPGSVLRPALRDSHVPERAAVWEEADEVPAPRPGAPAVPFGTAVRRVAFDAGAPAPAPAGVRLAGPALLKTVSGGEDLDREYWFLKTPRGEVVWARWDRRLRQARTEGTVD